jgi:hypothetical protein
MIGARDRVARDHFVARVGRREVQHLAIADHLDAEIDRMIDERLGEIVRNDVGVTRPVVHGLVAIEGHELAADPLASTTSTDILRIWQYMRP